MPLATPDARKAHFAPGYSVINAALTWSGAALGMTGTWLTAAKVLPAVADVQAQSA